MSGAVLCLWVLVVRVACGRSGWRLVVMVASFWIGLAVFDWCGDVGLCVGLGFCCVGFLGI